ETLSAREREVMVQVTAGRLNKQIAHDIGITESTVKVHRTNLMGRWKPARFPSSAECRICSSWHRKSRRAPDGSFATVLLILVCGYCSLFKPKQFENPGLSAYRAPRAQSCIR